MTSKYAWYLLSALALLSCAHIVRAASGPPLKPGCYVIVDPKDKPDLDNADEVLCVDASGHASVRESSLFGEGIKGCNVVTITSQRDALVVDIDYRKCTNNSPSHKLTCHAEGASGAFACTNTMGSGKDDEMQAKLVPLPADQSNRTPNPRLGETVSCSRA